MNLLVVIVIVVILITLKGAEMRPGENFEIGRDGIDLQQIQKHVEEAYCDYDTPTSTPSMEETIYKEKKIRDEDGGRRSERSPPLINLPTRLVSRRKPSSPPPSNSKRNTNPFDN